MNGIMIEEKGDNTLAKTTWSNKSEWKLVYGSRQLKIYRKPEKKLNIHVWPQYAFIDPEIRQNLDNNGGLNGIFIGIHSVSIFFFGNRLTWWITCYDVHNKTISV